ncbi:hypothetical protein Tco_1532417 [Tanacetum coccineum]
MAGLLLSRLVSHPNGTESLITKVGNLVLTKFLTLYDVLVVPEYYVTLVSVHKVARDNNFIVGFDESKCILMSQDLMDVKIMGIGKQVNGLYYFDNIEDRDQSILQNDLSVFGNKTENMPCDIFQKAKQTRERFPLSEHKSTVLAELVHLDLWGPYKVVSNEGHRPAARSFKSKHIRTLVDDSYFFLLSNQQQKSEDKAASILLGLDCAFLAR